MLLRMKPAVIAGVVAIALMARYPDDGAVPTEEMIRRGRLGLRAYEEKIVDLRAEDILLIKKYVAKAQSPLVIVRVHDMVPREVWEARYDEINAFEKRVVESGTTLIKVALALSKDEQRERLARRLRRPDKYWKFDPSDVAERGYWNDYMAAYDAVFERTSTEYAPWHVVPCDRKWYSRVAVTELLVEALHGFDLDWPAADFDVEEQRRLLRES